MANGPRPVTAAQERMVGLFLAWVFVSGLIALGLSAIGLPEWLASLIGFPIGGLAVIVGVAAYVDSDRIAYKRYARERAARERVAKRDHEWAVREAERRRRFTERYEQETSSRSSGF